MTKAKFSDSARTLSSVEDSASKAGISNQRYWIFICSEFTLLCLSLRYAGSCSD